MTTKATASAKKTPAPLKTIMDPVIVNGPLTDIKHHADLFAGAETGKYIIEFHTSTGVLILPVFWDGTTLHA